MIAAALARTGVRARACRTIGLTEIPACGTNAEVLAYHGLDAAGIATNGPGVGRRGESHVSQARHSTESHVPDCVPHWIADVEVTSNDAAIFEKRNPAIDDGHRAGRARRRRGSGARAVVGGRRRRRRGRARRHRSAAPFSAARRSCCASASRRFGEIVQVETGKPWKNAVAEVASSADLAIFMEGEGSRFYGKTMPSPIPNRTRADAALADRHLRGDHAVQQPARRRGVEGVSRAAVRQCRRRQVARADAVHRGGVWPTAEGCRACRSASMAPCRAIGPDAGAPLVQDDRVGVVSFTGSSRPAN